MTSHSIQESNPSAPVVLVTGSRGMLGMDVCRALKDRGVVFTGADRSDCDVTSAESCMRALERSRSTIVINCAAYTDVNRAESEEEQALAINGTGVKNLAQACFHHGARLIHVSTDYVFDGEKAGAWEPGDPVNPINAYGRTKLAGEQAIASEMSPGQWMIARTSWLYGVHGKSNFVKTMLRLADEGRDITVIHDQRGAPTYTVDLASALVDIAMQKVTGVHHVTNSGACTWFEFAQTIFELSDAQPSSISPCTSDTFPTPARRPANSVLSAASLVAAGIKPLPHWRDGLERYLIEAGRRA